MTNIVHAKFCKIITSPSKEKQFFSGAVIFLKDNHLLTTRASGYVLYFGKYINFRLVVLQIKFQVLMLTIF